ncbi:hypothetical protein DYL59_30900 [Pseudomonas kairouanensis]|uniref:DUF3077 domain-containing protein n=1 Tax=Pseudomonas kairouanensis TaxID=2293832 RepID=A0A4Z0ABF7_9PSED|nr:DUF6124 family protein [Pseudomonas kairouanensis]TFY84095.1 hypothetical protein DYL59_30900 [Pseudomonas kairouanensis]
MISNNLRSDSNISDAKSQPVDDQPTDQLFTVRPSLDSETLLANAAQDIASVQALMGHLAFEIDGAQRDIALGAHRMLEGIQLMVDRVLDLNEVPEFKSSATS